MAAGREAVLSSGVFFSRKESPSCIMERAGQEKLSLNRKRFLWMKEKSCEKS